MGMVLTTISLFTPDAIAAAVYYIVHSTLAAAALFLISDLIRAGRANLEITAQPPVAGAALTAAMFFTAAIAMAGLPPLSGFVGKLLVLDAAFYQPQVAWIWAVVLIASLVNVVGFARAGSTVFWKAKSLAPEGGAMVPMPATLSYVAVGGLLALIVAHTVFAGPMRAYTGQIAQDLFAPEPYISTVLDTPGKLQRPGEGYDGYEGTETPTDTAEEGT
jgi:multicomponent K+:H+ antiporter subunit D